MGADGPDCRRAGGGDMIGRGYDPTWASRLVELRLEIWRKAEASAAEAVQDGLWPLFATTSLSRTCWSVCAQASGDVRRGRGRESSGDLP